MDGTEAVSAQIRYIDFKMANHKTSEYPRLQPRSNNYARVWLEGQRNTGNQFVITLIRCRQVG